MRRNLKSVPVFTPRVMWLVRESSYICQSSTPSLLEWLASPYPGYSVSSPSCLPQAPFWLVKLPSSSLQTLMPPFSKVLPSSLEMDAEARTVKNPKARALDQMSPVQILAPLWASFTCLRLLNRDGKNGLSSRGHCESVRSNMQSTCPRVSQWNTFCNLFPFLSFPSSPSLLLPLPPQPSHPGQVSSWLRSGPHCCQLSGTL